METENTKKWYQSKTNLFAIAIVLFNAYIQVDAQIGILPDIPVIARPIIDLILGGGIIWGRSKAEKTISGKLF